MNEVSRLNEPMPFGGRAFRTFFSCIYDERPGLLMAVPTHLDVAE
jgi:hypothetical protein